MTDTPIKRVPFMQAYMILPLLKYSEEHMFIQFKPFYLIYQAHM